MFLLFFCSGATALIYEVVWSKYLSLMLGSTVQAQTVVLAVFMGGLALGNYLIGRWSDWTRQPLAGYGFLEVGIGGYAFFFETLYSFADRIFVLLGSRMLDQPGLMLLLKGLLSVALLLLPTVLMGGTLPLLAAWLQRSSEDAGRWSARFYSLNSLGAVFGAACAGFYLIRALGLASTLQMTALANIIVGFTAVGLSRRNAGLFKRIESATPAKPALTEARGIRWTAVLVALTGGVSMGLEVLCSRSLSLLFGASVQAFAIVLMAFILGIGIGSGLVASPRFQRWRDESAVMTFLLLAAAVIGLLITGIEQWVTVYRYVRSGLAQSTMGYLLHQIIAGLFSIVILGLPAALIGAVLPACIRWEGNAGACLGNRVGLLLTWNTVGAASGVLLTGFGFMPLLGLRNSFAALAGLLCLGAVWLGVRTRRHIFSAGSVGILACLILACVATGEGWKHVLSSGVFRARETEVDPTTLDRRKQHIKILYYRDAADATVTVEQGDGIGASDELGLRINGKPDASNKGDMSSQLLVAHLPMLMRPSCQDVFMLGLASGISGAAVLAHPVKQLVIAENCEPVLEASRFFTPWNRGLLTNPLARIRLEDARTLLKLSQQQYDVIISQPSNPWFASVGSIFSVEYYDLAASRLKPGGVMAQWFHVYEMHDGIVDLVLRTFCAVFPYVEVWDASAGDLVLLGSKQPWDSGHDVLQRAYAHKLVSDDLASIGLATPQTLMARQLASQKTAHAIAEPGPIQSDAFPILEYDAPEAFFVGHKATGLWRFDERTWQLGFVDAKRRQYLMNLGSDALKAIFTFGTCNSQLGQALADHQRLTEDRSLLSRSNTLAPPMPCLFWPGQSAEVLPGPNQDKSASDSQVLRQARARLLQSLGDWKEAVQEITAILQQHASTPQTNNLSLDWNEFVAIGAGFCIAHSDLDQAQKLLDLGARLAPETLELRYLKRILERERLAMQPQGR